MGDLHSNIIISSTQNLLWITSLNIDRFDFNLGYIHKEEDLGVVKEVFGCRKTIKVASLDKHQISINATLGNKCEQIVKQSSTSNS